jgi:hypothetical protein
MSTIDVESTAVVSTSVVPSLTDPFGAIVAVGGIAMAVVMYVAARSFVPARAVPRARPDREPEPEREREHVPAEV